jgi:methylglyoxal synthase
MEFILQSLAAHKSVALIAHDNKKANLIAWCQAHQDVLKTHRLYATGTTGSLIENATALKLTKLMSGPLGGDQQVGALISEGLIDVLIFFWDPFEPLPHDPDVKALLRVAAVWDVAVACTEFTANFLIQSPLFNTVCQRRVPDYARYLNDRAPHGGAN